MKIKNLIIVVVLFLILFVFLYCLRSIFLLVSIFFYIAFVLNHLYYRSIFIDHENIILDSFFLHSVIPMEKIRSECLSFDIVRKYYIVIVLQHKRLRILINNKTFQGIEIVISNSSLIDKEKKIKKIKEIANFFS